jgi:formate-dependent nitrite reductase membrane component NrfD
MPVNEAGITYDDRPITSVEVLKVIAYLNLVLGLGLGIYSMLTMSHHKTLPLYISEVDPAGIIVSLGCFTWGLTICTFLLVIATIADNLRQIREKINSRG